MEAALDTRPGDNEAIVRTRVDFEVTPDGLTGSWPLATWLSAPVDHSGILLVLVHGAYMTHEYWDSPHRPEVYSLVDWCMTHGLATLALDRLGHGASGRPLGDRLTAPVHAQTYHQILEQVRSAGVLGRRFDRIVLVGHSFGSLSSGLMQQRYGSADGLVYTGITGPNVLGINDTAEANEAFLSLATALPDDPRFADRLDSYDEHYFSWAADRRARAFFRVPPAEEAMLELDARVLGTMTSGENGTLGLAADAAGSVTCPVLVQLGRYDRLFFNPRVDPDVAHVYAQAKAAAEPNFTFAPLVADAGHNLTQHPNARDTCAQMTTWVHDVLGRRPALSEG